MRCVGKCCQQFKWCYFSSIMAAFVSLTAYAGITATSTHAAHLIHYYSQRHVIHWKMIKQLQPNIPDKLTLQQKRMIDREQPKFAELSELNEVSSNKLTLGKIQPRKINDSLSVPIFIVSEDYSSINWLRRHYLEFIKIHAVGLIIHLISPSTIRRLRTKLPKLVFFNMPGNILANCLHVKHYPLLIYKHWISQ